MFGWFENMSYSQKKCKILCMTLKKTQYNRWWVLLSATLRRNKRKMHLFRNSQSHLEKNILIGNSKFSDSS